jgi:anti-sigma regulatory factor (Ser/Thr protein kinase)
VLQLDRVRGATALARRSIRTRLHLLVTQDALDDVLLIVSELVTNAVLHGSGAIALRLEFDGRRITGRVSDEGRGFASRGLDRPADRIGGNGLHIVEQIASRWGVNDDASQVWFEIDDTALVTQRV